MSDRPVIVTRPGEPGARLTRELIAAGAEALWIPAFTIGPPPDEGRVAATLADLASYELVIFVSPAAAEATASRLAEPWPAGTAVGVVGAGTQRAVLRHIASASDARWFVPDAATGEGDGGSEALWQVLEPALGQIRRALILRAQHGREWLGEQLAQAGIETDTLAVYARETATVAPAEAAQLRRWKAEHRHAVFVMTSSEAVEAAIAQMETVTGRAWLDSGRYLAPHERIVARLRDAGFADARCTPLDVEAIRKVAHAQ